MAGKLAKDTHDSGVFAHWRRPMWDVLQSQQTLALLRRITSIPDLKNDEHLHWAGLHYHQVSMISYTRRWPM